MSRREELTKVFVGSLPANVTVEQLRELFSPYGVIAECDIANRCGFLHLEDKELAEKAISELNDTDFMGARISVEKGRVKNRGERRGGRGGGGRGGGGGMGGRKRDSGPYSRDGGFNRGGGPPRNNFRGDQYRSFDNYGGGRFDERRPPMFDDRRGGGMGGGAYMDRGNYSNGFDRRPYPDDRPFDRFDESRMPPGPGGPPPAGGFSDRRAGPPPVSDRRPLLDDQPVAARPQSYDRAPPPQASGDIYSRRDAPPPKPLGTGYDRPPQGGGGGYSYAGGYASNPPPAGNYSTGGAGFGAAPPSAAYGDGRGGNNYGDASRASSGPLANQGGYSSGGSSYNALPPAGTGGGFGDSYGARGGAQSNYDSTYPPLPQQRGFAGGNAPGPHRDMPSARRYN